MKTILANWQLYTQQYAQFTQNRSAIELSSISINDSFNESSSESEGENG